MFFLVFYLYIFTYSFIMSSDKRQVDNMFVSDEYVYDETMNVDRQILFTQDENNNDGYLSGIQFNLNGLRSKLVPLNEARLVGGLKIEYPQTATANSGSLFTFPQTGWTLGEMGLISGITVQTSNGVVLLNNTQLQLRNYVRYLQSRSAEHRNQGDAYDTGIVPEDDALSPLPGTSSAPINAAYTTKANLFAANAYYTLPDASHNATVQVPFDIALKDLDPFFEAMDFLLTNVGLIINFQIGFNLSNNDIRTIDVAPYYIPAATGAPTTTVNLLPPILSIVNGIAAGTGTACRIYYPSVTPNAIELEKINRRLASGWTKELEFLIPQVLPFTKLNVNTQQSITPATAVVLPQKVHVLVYPSGWFNNTVTGALPGTAPLYGVGAPPSIPVPINTMMLEVDDKQYFMKAPLTFAEKWWLQKENLIDKAESDIFVPLFQKRDFMWAYAGLNTYDVSRLQSRIINPLASTPIRLTLNFGDKTMRRNGVILDNTYVSNNMYGSSSAGALATVDIYCITERLQKLRFDISKSDVQAILGVSTSAGGR